MISSGDGIVNGFRGVEESDGKKEEEGDVDGEERKTEMVAI